MTLRRTSLVFIVPVLWVIAATYYWRTSVLLLPERVFDLPKGTSFRGFASNGDAVLVHTVRPGARADGHTDVGPLERWKIPELTKVSEVFTADDAIDMARPDSQGRIVLVRDGKAWLADFETGKLLEELPGVETKPCQKVLHNNRLLWSRDQTVFVYDLVTKKVLASHPQNVSISQVTDSLAILTGQWTVGAWNRAESTVLNSVTGEIDHRFDEQGDVEHVELAPNGELAVVYTVYELVICDASSGKRMWTVPRPYLHIDHVRFEQDSTVLAVDVLDRWKKSRTVRWRVSDGVVIAPVPSDAIGMVNREINPQGDYAIDNHFYEQSPFEEQVERVIYGFKRWFGAKNLSWNAYHSIWEVRDLKADRPVGVYSYMHCGAIFAPDGSGFVAATDEDMNNHRMRYYRLPPARDWGWLVRWGVWPAIGYLMLLIIGRRRRVLAGRRISE